MSMESNRKKFITQKKTIGMIHGVFDIIHHGHILYFKEAKSKVDYLIVSVTSDKFVNKGPGKPIFDLKKRIEVLKSIKYIDEVIISDYKTAINNLKIIKPHYYIKGKDYKNLKNDLTKQILFEKKTIEQYGGKIIFTRSELHSSSSIANSAFDYINDDIKKILKKIDKKKFEQNFLELNHNKLKKKILIIGDPIIDILRFVETSGKSNKSNVISTKYLKEEKNPGGVLLVANFLNLFFKNVTLLYTGKLKNLNTIRKYLHKSIKIKYIKTKNELIKKIRYTDNYSKQKVFQNNLNEQDIFTKAEEKQIINQINRIKNDYDELLLFDYGYIYSNKKFIESINNLSKKISINCQSNSYNFGYNLADKYKSGKIISMDEPEFRLVTRNKQDEIDNIIKKNLKLFDKFKYLIVTQGKKGCFLKKNKTLMHVPCVLNTAIDTTGAGDIFLSMFFTLETSNLFSDYELLIISHIAAGLHSNQIGNRFRIDFANIYKVLSSILK